MPNQKRTDESARPATVNVRVEPEMATRFNVGARWEVVASSLESLWQGAHTITLREVEAEKDHDR